MKITLDKYERFIAAYLRLNAYFTITHFIVHAGDDPGRVFAGHVGSHTETDILGIRMPYSVERAGRLSIANHELLVSASYGKTDVVIAEVKSGKDNRPNAAWKTGKPEPVITYVVRFMGLHDEANICPVADALASSFRYEDDRCRFRYIIFAREPNKDYTAKGVTYIAFQDVIAFLVSARGQSWIGVDLGVASIHTQWDDVLRDVFEIANDHSHSVADRIGRVEQYLAT